MKQILILFLILFSTLSVADNGTVRITNTAYTGITNRNSFSLYGEMPSGDGTAETAPGKVYIPIENTVNSQDTKNYFNLNIGSSGYDLFGYNSTLGLTGSGGLFSYVITFPLTIASTIQLTQTVYAAVKNLTGYMIVKQFGTYTTNSTTSFNDTFSLSPQTICKAADGASVNCSNFDQSGTVTPAAGEKDIIVYFFATNGTPTLGSTTTDLTLYPGGVFVSAKMSNIVYPSPFSITISNPRVGDGRILGTENPATTLDPSIYRQTVAFYGVNGSGACTDVFIASCSNYTSSFVLGNSQAMDFIFSGLSNDTAYSFSVGLQDKFGFVTALSNEEVNMVPLKIDELLKKQTCFLLTAGFGEEHYIIDYFRHFRSEVLSKYWLGQKFISFYYKTAPKYALSAYNNQTIRFIIRSFAYVLYFIFHSFWWIFAGFMIILLIVFYKKYHARNEL